jgi:Zn-finger nucleic acid-binding protein
MARRRKHVDLHPNQTCPLCREVLEGAPPETLTICGRCDVVYHKACARELGGNRCAVPGCVPPAPGGAEPPGPPCPRYGEGLRDGAYKKVPGAYCTGCGGLLVGQRDLRRFLEQLARDLLESIDADTPVRPVPDAGGGLRCPRCREVMEHYGYMGTRLVLIDRCDACAAVWLDADELGRLALLFARTGLRQQAYAADLGSRPAADEAAAVREARELLHRYFAW